MRILITGGTGSLGRHLVRASLSAGYDVCIMSRQPRAQDRRERVEWAQADFATGEGLRAAVEQADAIIHAASDPRRSQVVDVDGTRRLVEAARTANVSHLVYISIVGVDVIPYSYYRRKLEAERIIESSGVHATILRATQFHSFVDFLISKAARVPFLLPLPTEFRFQSVEESEVAERLIACLADGPRGRVTDFGGPEVLTLGEMAKAWSELKGVRKSIVRLPLPGAVAAAFRDGKNTAPQGERGRISWREWLGRETKATFEK